MTEVTQKKLARGSGGSLMAIAIGLFASGWPEYIRSHPNWVAGVVVFSAVLLLYGFIAPQNSAEADLGQLNSVGHDNLGQQIIAPNSTFNLHSSVSGAVAPSKTDEKPVVSIPTLQVRRERCFFDYTPAPGCWTVAAASEMQTKSGILLWFSNPPAPKGEKGMPVRDVVAQLTFRHVGGTTHVPRAYWLERTEHQIDIETGYEMAVVVGYFDPLRKALFVSHENPHQYDGGNDYFSVPFRQLGKMYDISTEKTFTVDVSLIDTATNETLECKRLEMMMPQEILGMPEMPEM